MRKILVLLCVCAVSANNVGAYTKPNISKYIDNVVEVKCIDKNKQFSRGSGFLVYVTSKIVSLYTNKHVTDGMEYCVIFDNKGSGLHYFYANKGLVYNKTTDFISYSIPIEKVKHIDGMNFMKDVYYCGDVNIGDTVRVVGYPSYAADNISGVDYQITTKGIVAGFRAENDKYGNPLHEYYNYFISNRIDGGNSGGLSLMENDGSFCILGIPTWMKHGDYENISIVQNIHNVTNKDY